MLLLKLGDLIEQQLLPQARSFCPRAPTGSVTSGTTQGRWYRHLGGLINSRTQATGVVAHLDLNHRIVLTADDGRNIGVQVSGNGTRLGLAAAAGRLVAGGRLRLASSEPIVLSGSAISKLGDVEGQGKHI